MPVVIQKMTSLVEKFLNNSNFSTVVQLKHQIRVRDVEWNDVLGHIRRGNCRQRHIDIIKKLIITNPACPPTDFNKAPWKDARLITPH